MQPKPEKFGLDGEMGVDLGIPGEGPVQIVVKLTKYTSDPRET